MAMTTEFNPPADPRPEWHDAFPEPRTFPSGWDLSDVLAIERERLKETGPLARLENGDGATHTAWLNL
jgi:hypothetical protein